MISRQHFDVEIPLDEPEASAAEPCFHRGKHHFSLQCLWPVLDLALASANRGSYSAILKLDKKIRDWTLPKHMKITKNFPPSEDQQTAYTFQRTVIFIVREVSLMCLHRYASIKHLPHQIFLINMQGLLCYGAARTSIRTFEKSVFTQRACCVCERLRSARTYTYTLCKGTDSNHSVFIVLDKQLHSCRPPRSDCGSST